MHVVNNRVVSEGCFFGLLVHVVNNRIVSVGCLMWVVSEGVINMGVV